MTPDERRLAVICRQISDTADGLADWAASSARLMPSERVALQDEFFRANARARKLTRAVVAPPVLGVVGPPGVGKTQLIASLLGAAAAPLHIAGDAAGLRLEPTRHLVPIGSTAPGHCLVRFTGRNRQIRRDFPLDVRLLSLADVATILGESFLGEATLAMTPIPTAAHLRVVHLEAEQHISQAVIAGLGEADVMALRDYFCSRHSRHPLVQALTSAGFWDSVAELGPYLTDAARVRLLRPLWGGRSDYDAVFSTLASTLAALGHVRDLSCNLTAVATRNPDTGEYAPRADTILSSGALESFAAADAADPVAVYSTHTRATTIARPALAALAAELKLAIEAAQGTLAERTDIVEYPAVAATLAAGRVPIARRFGHAKTTFLLDRDVEANEITALLVVLDCQRPIVGPLAAPVDRWVIRTHGADAETRERRDRGLFVALTKFDRAFADASTLVPDQTSAWDALVARLVGDFGHAGTWAETWTPGRPFDAIHPVMTPTARSDLRAAGADRDIVARARLAFLDSPQVRRHVADAAAVWDDAFAAGNGGVVRLAAAIAEVCHARTRFRQLYAEADALRTAVSSRLCRYLPGDPSVLPFGQRRADALVVTHRLRAAADARRFNALFAALSLSDSELAEVYRDLQSRLAAAGGGETAERRSGDFDLLLARAALDAWVGRVRAFARGSQNEIEFRVPSPVLLSLIDEVLIGANRTRMETKLAERIGATAKLIADPGRRLDAAASAAARLLNNYLFHLGFDNPRGNTHLRRRAKPDQPIFARHELHDKARAADELDDAELAAHSDWAQAFMALVDDNIRDLADAQGSEADARELTQFLTKLQTA